MNVHIITYNSPKVERADKWISKMGYNHTMEYDLSIKGNGSSDTYYNVANP